MEPEQQCMMCVWGRRVKNKRGRSQSRVFPYPVARRTLPGRRKLFRYASRGEDYTAEGSTKTSSEIWGGILSPWRIQRADFLYFK